MYHNLSSRQEYLDSMLLAYIQAALWSSNDDSDDNEGVPLDTTYTKEDLAPSAREMMSADCVYFLTKCRQAGVDVFVLDPKQVGHDFWLTRNHHGAGFWDCPTSVYPKDVGQQLTDMAHSFREVSLVVGDGLIYCLIY